MLPAESRMRRREDFTLAVQRGARTGRKLLTGHLLAGVHDDQCAPGYRPGGAERRPGDTPGPPMARNPPLVGFVVNRSVGNAVVRNRVRRRLRMLVRAYLPLLPGGSLLVVRAHPQAATARQADLAAELDLVLNVLLRRQVGTVRR